MLGIPSQEYFDDDLVSQVVWPVGENSLIYLNIIYLMANSSFQCQQVYFYDGSWILLVAVSCWSQITPRGIANRAGSTAGAWVESHSMPSHRRPVQLAHWSSLCHVSSPYHALLQQVEFQKDGYDNIFILGTCSVGLKTSLICEVSRLIRIQERSTEDLTHPHMFLQSSPLT